MSAVDKSNAVRQVTFNSPPHRKNYARRTHLDDSDSKTNDAGVGTLIEPAEHRYPTRSRVIEVPPPADEQPLLKRQKTHKVNFDTFLDRAVASVQRDYPQGRAAAMKWSMKVEDAGENLRQIYASKEKHEIRKLFNSDDQSGVKKLLKEMAKNQ